MSSMKIALFIGLAALMAVLSIPASAGDIILSDNKGTKSTEWFVTGESSLVMNGFDLSKAGIQLPVVLDKASITVRNAVPGTPIQVVVYQDANGGSPVDAAMVASTVVDIPRAGVFTATFDKPALITQPIVWVGFYLPVGFRFLADTSGTSVLTYWAWKTGSAFDLGNLASASVIGPADGTAPVNLDMKGIARITAQVSAANGGQAANANTGGQIPGNSATNLAPLHPYPFCSPLLIDDDDVSITLHQEIAFYCKVADPNLAPPPPSGYVMKGFLYDVFVFGDTAQGTQLPAPVTHCIRPAAEDLDKAVFGVANGAPRFWKLLLTERYNDLICAEVSNVGYMAYFVPAQ